MCEVCFTAHVLFLSVFLSVYVVTSIVLQIYVVTFTVLLIEMLFVAALGKVPVALFMY